MGLRNRTIGFVSHFTVALASLMPAGIVSASAEDQAVTAQIADKLVGRWEWVAFKETFMGDKSDKIVRKDGWEARGVISFSEDARYSIESVGAPPKLTLTASGTYAVAGGEVLQTGRHQGRAAGSLVLSAAVPRQRLTRPTEALWGSDASRWLMNKEFKKHTEERVGVTLLDSDHAEIHIRYAQWYTDHMVWALVRVTEPTGQPGASSTGTRSAPLELRIGMTEAEVVGVAGSPDARAELGEKIIYRYPTMVVTFVGGFVRDVSFR